MTYAYSFPSFIVYQSSAGLHWVPEAFHALFPVSASLKAGVFYRLGSHNTPINVMPAGRCLRVVRPPKTALSPQPNSGALKDGPGLRATAAGA